MQLKVRTFPNGPGDGLTRAVSLLQSAVWEKEVEGLELIASLAQQSPEVIMGHVSEIFYLQFCSSSAHHISHISFLILIEIYFAVFNPFMAKIPRPCYVPTLCKVYGQIQRSCNCFCISAER